jgi:mannosyltransferase OCH1-like enzyme
MSPISKKIHQIWLGSQLRTEYKGYSEKLRSLHPEWEYKLWSEKELGWLAHKGEFDSAQLMSIKSNIARYEVVWNYGGVYMDMDFDPVRPLDGLLADASMLVCPERSGLLGNAFFAAAQQHPVLGYVVKKLAENISANISRRSPEMCGPVFLQKL